MIAAFILFGFLRGKCRSGETSYQMLEVLSFCDQERILPPSTEMTVLTFLIAKKAQGSFLGCLFFFLIKRKNCRLNIVLVFVLLSNRKVSNRKRAYVSNFISETSWCNVNIFFCSSSDAYGALSL